MKLEWCKAINFGNIKLLSHGKKNNRESVFLLILQLEHILQGGKIIAVFQCSWVCVCV